MIGALTHGGIYLIKHFTQGIIYSTFKQSTGSTGIVRRLVDHKQAIISHLSWISLWLGFHTLLLYAHKI